MIQRGDSRPFSATNRRNPARIFLVVGCLLIGATALVVGAAALSSDSPSDPEAPAAARTATATTAAGIGAPTSTHAAPTAQSTTPLPQVSAAAFIAVNASTGEVLLEYNADARRATASLAKMAGALVVRQAILDGVVAVDEPVTIQESDIVDPAEFSHMGLQVGDTVTVEQLLYGALVPSGNDAAKALARFVGARLPGGDPDAGGDPVAAFVTAMNDHAVSLGLSNTHFVNPEGTDHPGAYGTARDLARIGQAVLESELLSRIVATGRIDLVSIGPEQRLYELFNTNRMLARPDVIGIKTGTTDAAGACLAVVSQLPSGERIIVVVLGSAPDPAELDGDPLTWPRYADAQAILDDILTR